MSMPLPQEPAARSLAALLELMSEFAWSATEPHERPRVAAAIVACLERLAADTTAPPWLQSVAGDLGDRWQQVGARCGTQARVAARASILALVRASARGVESGRAG